MPLPFPITAIALASALAQPFPAATSESAGRPMVRGVVQQSPPRTDLKDRLEKGLKARRPVEFAFIARVDDLVVQGTLPRKLVDRTFFWARSKPRHPFQYFERALRIHAGRLGIRL